MPLPSQFKLAAGAAVAALALALPAVASASFLRRHPQASPIASAVPAAGPAAGDQNPYGVVVVPRSAGDLAAGDVLVSNFNDAANQQGTGSSIVEISPAGAQHVFAVVPQPTATPAVGLTTALVALRNGDVVVGSLPAPGGDPARMTAGALTILDSRGHVVRTLTAPDINGPWDMTAVDDGPLVTLFVTNVLNGTVAAGGATVDGGTVVRIRLLFTPWGVLTLDNRVIADGFGEHTDPNALVVGPTGLGLGRGDVLYVADSVGNRIAAIPDALLRRTAVGGGAITVSASSQLNDPLGLAITPRGHIITANGGDGNVVETTPGGATAAVSTLVPDGAGDLFGVAVQPGVGLYFVNDSGSGSAANSLELLH